jgi:Holliday junction resolvase RusA-like endonuclease
MSAAVLEIIIPGKPISGNHAKVPTENGAQVRSEKSREYDKRIVSIAKAAVVSSGWTMPDYVKVDVILWNIRADRENVLKEIHDPLEGIVFARDSRILDGRTRKFKDGEGPRVILEISEVDGSDYGYDEPRKPKPADPRNIVLGSTWDEVQAEARRRTANKPRTLAQMKSGDQVKSFAERDAVLREAGIVARR